MSATCLPHIFVQFTVSVANFQTKYNVNIFNIFYILHKIDTSVHFLSRHPVTLRLESYMKYGIAKKIEV